MKTRALEFHEDATSDLLALYDWLAEVASPEAALGYFERIETYCRGFDIASERGRLREVQYC
ncbi:MAG: type II toxin-antitoxin system RelE/ParE family toxin [Kofleriaceae bacterium]|nr:type II toxin-antitoxin system RelE/ParE family toxin [Kofleriaceae bacterium]